jgi:hypothetical protein
MINVNQYAHQEHSGLNNLDGFPPEPNINDINRFDIAVAWLVNDAQPTSGALVEGARLSVVRRPIFDC